MLQIDRSPSDQAAWDAWRTGWERGRPTTTSEAPADSWFIDDVQGIQVARSPRSDRAAARIMPTAIISTARARICPRTTKDLKPIESPHLSAVYRSTSTGHLKVSFSVPIENGRSGEARKVIGVLAMSVDLASSTCWRSSFRRGRKWC